MGNSKRLRKERVDNIVSAVPMIMCVVLAIYLCIITAKTGAVRKEARGQLEQLVVETASKNEIVDIKEAIELAYKADYDISLDGVEVDVIAKNIYEYEVIGIDKGNMVLILKEKQEYKSE